MQKINLNYYFFVFTEIITFDLLFKGIYDKISKESLRKIYYCYLSEAKESSNLIFSLARHRFTGFVRFKEVNGILYSSIEPDFNIVGLLGNHFKSRLTNEYFIIHDTKRNIALVYNKDSYYLTSLDTSIINLLESTDDTGDYAKLWKEYFKATEKKYAYKVLEKSNGDYLKLYTNPIYNRLLQAYSIEDLY